MTQPVTSRMWEVALGFFVDNKVVAFVLAGLCLGAGIVTSPFDWNTGPLPRDPVAVDAIPDIGENQQIVFTEWAGRSPRDIEDQITYPLTTALLGIPGVKTVRSSSMFGFSSIYVIFEDGVEFYWSRSRVLEKIAALPAGTLPDDVTPTLGPDATALGQVFWYTLEGRTKTGETTDGWDLHELRSIQDWTVRFALQSVGGVAEVASIGGHVREYQIDVNPEAVRAHGIHLADIAEAVRGSNLDTGARTLEINRAEYVVRGVGTIENLLDLEQTVVTVRGNVPLRVADVAQVSLGPANRRGALDYGGAEAVGGVVIMRFGANPLEVIEAVKEKIDEIAPGMPARTLEDGSHSRVTIVPFYDRTELVLETLETLSTALMQQLLITILVVLLMLRQLRTSVVIALLLPLAVLVSFVAMKIAGIDANVMSLAGIAIAIGTMVDMGIVLTENIVRHLEEDPDANRLAAVKRGAAEVAPAVLTAAATTIVSFLPVFALSAAAGKLFRPLAFAKTFALGGALVLAFLLIPALAHVFLGREVRRDAPPQRARLLNGAILVVAVLGLAVYWRPLGSDWHVLWNVGVVGLIFAAVAFGATGFTRGFEATLEWCLEHKAQALLLPAALILAGAVSLASLGREFMPTLDEGSFLYMPSTMPHASFGQSLELLQDMDAAIATIPEVKDVVGKLGRAETALDPAPVSMFETVVTYHPEFGTNEAGDRVRLWRDHIRNPDDIWAAIAAKARRPGLTGAPKLMPIATRIVMLQSGMRAPIGLRVHGPTLESLEEAGRRLEGALRQVPEIRKESVSADRVVGKPYLELEIDRQALGRFGLTVAQVQRVIQVGLGGRTLTRTIEGRERYPVRVRYMREERDTVEALGAVPVPTPSGQQIPLGELVTLRYVRGPQAIRSENTFLTSYVLFDRDRDVSEVEVVRAAETFLDARLASGELELPAGVSYGFAGTYENQLQSERRLWVLLPLAGILIFLLLYLQFRRTSTTLIIFSGVLVAVGGGFAGMGLYNLGPWPDLSVSVAVWVGVIALVGLATDNGVVLATYIKQLVAAEAPATVAEIRRCIGRASQRRVRPCLMTTATTAVALLPVITSQGKGADVMVPMALPIVGGVLVSLLSLFVVPVLYAAAEERRLTWQGSGRDVKEPTGGATHA